jgi:hypothetical protein
MESIANSDNVNSTKEEIVSQVLGRHRSGHVRGMGGGVIPTQSSSSRACQAILFDNHDEWTIKQQESEKKLQEIEKRLEESLSHISTLEASHATMQGQLDMMPMCLHSSI